MNGILLRDVAEQLQLDLSGDGELMITGVAPLHSAEAGDLGFLANPRYRSQLEQCNASALVMHPDQRTHWHGSALLADNPYAAFARVAALFETTSSPPAGIHPSAAIAEDALISDGASIGPGVCIGSRSRIEEGAVIGPGCVIGEDCIVGPKSRLVARVTLVCRVRIGSRVTIHPGAVIGADGFGLAMHQGHWLKVPQLGGVRIGDDCEIGANSTIDRGAMEDTVLEEDVRLDNQIQIGHNVHIGAHTAMAGCSAAAGSARIGRYCLIGGGAGILGHLEVADRVTITAMSLVSHSIREAGTYSSGTPLMANTDWRRSAVQFKRLHKQRDRSNKTIRNPEE